MPAKTPTTARPTLQGAPRPPDAVITPLGYFGTAQTGRTAESVRQKFGPIFGQKLYSSHEGHFLFHTTRPGHRGATLLFGEGNPQYRQPAYEWFVGLETAPGQWTLGERCDGHDDFPGDVKFGFRLPDVPVDQPEVRKAAASAHEARLAAAQTPEARRNQLDAWRRIGHLTQEEYDREVAALDAVTPTPPPTPPPAPKAK